MPLPTTDWTSVYGTGGFDSTSNMPDQADETTPGADDGNLALSSTVESLRDSVIEAETQIGDPTAPSNSSLIGLVKEDGTIEAVFSEKSSLASDDKILIEDSEASGAKKWAKVSSISGGGQLAWNWNYIPTTNPAGVTASPSYVYNFDGGASSLLDRMGNGLDLSAGPGSTTIYQSLVQAKKMLWFNQNTYFVSGADADGQIIGDMTAELVLFMDRNNGLLPTLLSCAASGETEATNSLYYFRPSSNYLNYQYDHEYGAGVNEPTLSFNGQPMFGVLQYVVLVRDATAKTLDLYINGNFVDQQTYTNNPTGGSSSNVAIGVSFVGGYHSVRVTAEAFSAASVLAGYQQLIA